MICDRNAKAKVELSTMNTFLQVSAGEEAMSSGRTRIKSIQGGGEKKTMKGVRK